MYPYQLSQVLADQRIHDMVVTAERHRRRVDDRLAPADRRAPFSHVVDGVARLLSLFYVPTPARDTSTGTSTSAAGPMGCVA